jgi:uncharacterized repeat protein (TIGR03803 family)
MRTSTGLAMAISRGASFAYQLTTSGVFTVLHKFTPTKGNTSVETVGVIQGPNGYLYGVASGDGTAGKGVVYELSTDGSAFNVLHNFGDGSVPNDGEYPVGIVTVGTDGNLYGVTPNGGSAGYGTVFKISRSGSLIERLFLLPRACAVTYSCGCETEIFPWELGAPKHRGCLPVSLLQHLASRAVLFAASVRWVCDCSLWSRSGCDRSTDNPA